MLARGTLKDGDMVHVFIEDDQLAEIGLREAARNGA
jgi:hypothetical protein